jgi:hypothetical protein
MTAAGAVVLNERAGCVPGTVCRGAASGMSYRPANVAVRPLPAPPAIRPGRPDQVGLRRSPRASPWSLVTEGPVTFVAFAALYIVVGWAAIFIYDTYNWDGLARIAQASAALYSRDASIVAIGFVWPPLPVVSDIPIVALLKPLGLVLLSGTVMSALYTAFALTQLLAILRLLGVPPVWRRTWVVVFAFHPLITQAGTMGLSEGPFLASLLLSLHGFLIWRQQGRMSGLVLSSLGGALAIWCRYEAVAWVAVAVVAIGWVFLLTHPPGTRRGPAEGTLIMYVVLPAQALAIWVIANWAIMGSPTYFLTGPGSTATTPDTASKVGVEHPFYAAMGSLPGTVWLMVQRLTDLAPLLLPATAAVLLLIWYRRRWADLGYLALAWSVLGFVFLIAFRGILPPWSRYFFWCVPASVLVAGLMYALTPLGWPRRAAGAAVLALLLVPLVRLPAQTIERLQPATLGAKVVSAMAAPPEVGGFGWVYGDLDEYRTLAAYLNRQPPGTRTLLDISIASPLVYLVDRPRDLVIAPDKDFDAILADPAGKVDQVLVPAPTFEMRGRSLVLQAHPGLYDGASWTDGYRQFPGPREWRLYQVRPAETP